MLRPGCRQYSIVFSLRKDDLLSQRNIPYRGRGIDKYFAAATAKAEIWRGPLAFGVSPLVNGSDAELLLLLPEHRGKNNAGLERISW